VGGGAEWCAYSVAHMLEAMRIEDEKLFRIVREERQIVGSKYTAKVVTYIYRNAGRRVLMKT
jgi:hypothetical protein